MHVCIYIYIVLEALLWWLWEANTLGGAGGAEARWRRWKSGSPQPSPTGSFGGGSKLCRAAVGQGCCITAGLVSGELDMTPDRDRTGGWVVSLLLLCSTFYQRLRHVSCIIVLHCVSIKDFIDRNSQISLPMLLEVGHGKGTIRNG